MHPPSPLASLFPLGSGPLERPTDRRSDPDPVPTADQTAPGQNNEVKNVASRRITILLFIELEVTSE